MYIKLSILVGVLLFYFYSGVNTQVTLGTTCTTPDQIPGICTNINNCSTLLNLLLTQSANPTTRNFLRQSVCENFGRTPIVCCPPQKSRQIDNSGNTINTNANNNVTNNKLPKSPNCGFSKVKDARIVNGVPAKPGEFPWMVALGYRNSKNPDMPKWLCGGSLITNKHILTAAHCVYNQRNLYLARIGDLDLFSDDDNVTPSTILLEKAKIHENYSPTKYTNDIAILTLKESVNNPSIWPICLPTNEPFRSMSYINFSPTLAGWGAVTFKGPTNPVLHQIFVPVLSNDLCKKQFGQAATIDEKIICAGSLNGDKDSCGGDSGGPLMNEINENNNNYRVYQIGIVSYGFRCATPGYPGVYTRVTAFIDWIQKNLD